MKTRNAKGQFAAIERPLMQWLCRLFGGHVMKTTSVYRSKYFGTVNQRCECCGFKHSFNSWKPKHLKDAVK